MERRVFKKHLHFKPDEKIVVAHSSQSGILGKPRFEDIAKVRIFR